MKIIEVKDFAPAPGNEWNALGYPGEGAYVLPNKAVVIVTGTGVFSVPDASRYVTDAPIAASLEAVPQAVPSESFILKALAIAQNPSLAIDLTK